MSDSLTAEKALEFVENLLVCQSGRRLSKTEEVIFLCSWKNLSYPKILDELTSSKIYISYEYCREIGSQLWNTIAKLFELPPDEVTKKTFPGLVEQQWKLRQQNPPPLIESPEPESSQSNQLTSEGFVGREQAVRELDELRAAGATCILIQSPGGVGKTVLAERYLSQRFDRPVLRFDLGKETQNISSAEGLIEQKLRDLGEEPGREFMVSCDRLRSKLKAEALPVLVDNLEPALDESGRLIETHRSYVELFRVLSDSSSKSLTLITSRERVRENLNISLYPLKHLSLEAWQEYFNQTNLQSETSVLAEIHQAYRGNALAMKVLRERISLDYGGQIEEYWKAHQTEDGVSVETDIENLISEQFERLATLHPMAYRLLCRMGCFRYQDVPTVPREGLLCLLWDLPAKGRVRVIEALCDRALVERVDGEYKLHPLIRDEAVERLRNSEDWEISNRIAAEFWTNSVEAFETERDAINALESYHQYLNIDDFDSAADVIAKEREHSNHWNEPLGCVFWRLGLLSDIEEAIEKIHNKASMSFSLARIYNVLGDACWMKGKIKEAVNFHFNSKTICERVLNLGLPNKPGEYIEDLYVLSFFNISLCKMDTLDFEDAIAFLKKAEFIALQYHVIHRHSFEISFCIAFCYSCLGMDELAWEILAKNESNSAYTDNIWSYTYDLVLTGKVMQNLQDFTGALKKYEKAIEIADKVKYPQVKGRALTGMGEINFIKNNFDASLKNHRNSIQILEKIGVKCDLAEAYYQLALTYQAMNDRPNSQVYFQKALTLWEKIEAPKQIERVHQSMELGSV